ncbi:MAG: hypothetical protein ISS19_19240 [Bacteroidales bacterium]|nr:hypothetical protein [Bacteroidales bacterium]
MKILTILLILFSFIHLFGQTPTLIFHSGFEPATVIRSIPFLKSYYADIVGIDYSVSPPNDWVNDLEKDPNIGTFNIEYQGGNNTMRLAQITADPTNPTNNVLWFWVKYPNASSGTKGRVQGNLYGSSNGFTNLYYTIRLYLPHDLDTLKYGTAQVHWFTLMEFWNNPNWNGDPYPFRVSVNLQRMGYVPDSLHFGVRGEMNTDTDSEAVVWNSPDTNFSVPINTWMKIEINYIQGDSTTGRFFMAVTPDGGSRTVVCDVTGYTYHPSNPNPDGLNYFSPFKLYTSDDVVDTLRNWGKLANVYWDDFEIWKDSTSAVTAINEKPFNKTVKVYPNPFNQKVVLEFSNPNNEIHTLTLIDSKVQLVRTITN